MRIMGMEIGITKSNKFPSVGTALGILERSNVYPGAIIHLSSPKPGHITGGSGRSARPGGAAGPGGTGRRQNNSPRRQATLALAKASKRRLLNYNCRTQNPNTPRASRLGAARDGAAERGRAVYRRVARARTEPSFLLPRASNTTVGNDPSETRTSEIPCKRTGYQNNRLTTGSSAFYHWDCERFSFLAADQCTVAHLSL